MQKTATKNRQNKYSNISYDKQFQNSLQCHSLRNVITLKHASARYKNEVRILNAPSACAFPKQP